MHEVEIAARFVEERERLGFSQTMFAKLIGLQRESLRRFEMGLSELKSTALSSAGELGVDVQYVLKGVRSINADAQRPLRDSNVVSISGNISGVGIAHGGANVSIVNTQKHVTKVKAETHPGAEHITVEQRAILKDLVDKIVETELTLKKAPKSHRAVWSSLNAHCRVNTYTLIPAGDFEKARKFLHQWLGRLNSSASAPVKDGDNWRKRHYAYIKINTKAPEDEAAVHDYMKRKFGTESLTDLANDELDAVYRYVAGRRNRAKR